MYNMGIKSFFQGIGRGLKRGFDKFVSGAGKIMGGAGTFLQQKAIPALASGATSVGNLLDKVSPLLDVAGPEASALAGEASGVAKQVGSGLGKFATFIGSDIANKPPVVANAQQILAFGQSPFGMAIRKSQGLKGPMSLADATSYASGVKPAPAPAPKPSTFVMPPMPKGLISPAPKAFNLIGSNPASYSPMKPSGIEAPPASDAGSLIKAVGSGSGMSPMLSM